MRKYLFFGWAVVLLLLAGYFIIVRPWNKDAIASETKRPLPYISAIDTIIAPLIQEDISPDSSTMQPYIDEITELKEVKSVKYESYHLTIYFKDGHSTWYNFIPSITD